MKLCMYTSSTEEISAVQRGKKNLLTDSGNSLVVLGHLKVVGGLTSKLYQQNIVIENI